MPADPAQLSLLFREPVHDDSHWDDPACFLSRPNFACVSHEPLSIKRHPTVSIRDPAHQTGCEESSWHASLEGLVPTGSDLYRHGPVGRCVEIQLPPSRRQRGCAPPFVEICHLPPDCGEACVNTGYPQVLFMLAWRRVVEVPWRGAPSMDFGSGRSCRLVVLLVWQAAVDTDTPWWMYAAVGVVTFVGAAFQAWDAERERASRAEGRLNAIHQARPSVALQLLVDEFYLLLEVRNDGVQGLFSATIETDGGGNGPLQPMPAIWDLTDSHQPVEIPQGAFARLRIASVDEERRYFTTPDGDVLEPDYGWKVYYHKLPGHRGWYGGRRDLDEPDADWLTVRVVVRSQPQLDGGFSVKQIRLVGRHAIDTDSGERYDPRVMVMDDYEEQY